MKKFILIFSFSLLYIFFFELKISASTSGICILKQQNKTYEIETPFYWYIAVKTTNVDNMLNEEINYSHTLIEIKNKDDCESLNNISPTYKQGLNSNFLNNQTTNFFYNKKILENSEQIYYNSLNIFNVPDLIHNTGFEITSTYISLDDLPPIIANDTINSTIIATVSNKFPVELLKEKIIAYDEVDGQVNVEIFEDNYSNNYNVLGTYSITFIATDNSNNSSYLSINIKVIDNVKPQIKGQTKLNSYMSNPLTINQIKDTLTITDNYDTDLKNIIIKYDNYSKNTSIEGNFVITFLAYDNSNNESLPFNINITMIDDIAPTIEGSFSYKISIKNLLDINTIINQLSIKDNIDQKPTIEAIYNTYTENFYKIGIYQISFIAKDKNKNSSSPFIVNIITEDTDTPIFYISQKFIGVDSNNQISIDNLIEIINDVNDIDTTTVKNISIIENSYSDNSMNSGTYKITLKYEYENNNQLLLESNIIVSNYTQKEEKKNTPRKSFWSVIKNFFTKIWNFLKKIFYKLEKLI